MSDIQKLVEQVTHLVSDSNTYAAKLYNMAGGFQNTTSMVQQLLQGTSSHNYQSVMGYLSIAQNQLKNAADNLVTASQTAENWLERFGTGGTMSGSVQPGDTRMTETAQTEEISSGETGTGVGSDTNSFNGLTSTQQETETLLLNGRYCKVFDHPFDANSKRICNQGSAYPTGPRGTCGCCASGTVVNKAGGNTTEHDIVATAWDNGFCDDDGGTSADSIAQLMTYMGVDSGVTSGTQLESLAEAVEQGHGVIIAVNARLFNPDMYRLPGGHALVLESVVRDAETNEILEFVVTDSNGINSVDAVKRVSPDVLRRAFSDFGNQSITTKNIIW